MKIFNAINRRMGLHVASIAMLLALAILGAVLGISFIWFIAGGVALIPYAALLFLNRCPSCRKPVAHNPIELFGDTKTMAWTPWVPEKRSQCSANLDG